jgi:three-Cys-motif partner protein
MIPNYELPEIENNGLIAPRIKPHSLVKYKALGYCLTMFSTGMKDKWGKRIYLDLFSGSGHSQLARNKAYYPGSPLISLKVRDPFDQYIFCELKNSYFSALTQRVTKAAPTANVKMICGDANEMVSEIIKVIPKGRKGSTVITFCLVDLFKIGNLKFRTIQKLSALYMDFLVLIPSYMDVRRNKHNYINLKDNVVSNFLDDPDWRSKWRESETKGIKIGLFILDCFGKKMAQIGFKYPGPQDALTIYVDGMGVPLYHLYLFSKHGRGVEFWQKTLKHFNGQLKLL